MIQRALQRRWSVFADSSALDGQCEAVPWLYPVLGGLVRKPRIVADVASSWRRLREAYLCDALQIASKELLKDAERGIRARNGRVSVPFKSG